MQYYFLKVILCIILASSSITIKEQPLKQQSFIYEEKQNLDIYHNFQSNNIDTFVCVMLPIIRTVLQEQNLTTDGELFLLKQLALESNYGKNAIGKYNLGGITARKGIEIGSYTYRKFNNLYEFTSYLVNLLNTRYQAFSATSDKEYVNKLHGNNASKYHYSESKHTYIKLFNSMKSLEQTYEKYNLYLSKNNSIFILQLSKIT